jgi:EthD domain
MEAFATSHKVQLLFKAKGGEPIPETLLFSARPRIGFSVRAGVRISRAPAGGSVVAGDGDGTFVGNHPSAVNVDRVFDAMWEVASPTPDWEMMTQLAQARVGALAAYVDRLSSAVSAGTEWTLVPGGADQDATMLLYPMRRLSRLTAEEFHDYWLHVHSRFGIGNPHVAGYRQFHVDHTASAESNADLGLGTSDFDGVAESFLPTLEAFGNIKTDRGQAQHVLEDESRFIDYQRSATMELYRYRVLVPGQTDGA